MAASTHHLRGVCLGLVALLSGAACGGETVLGDAGTDGPVETDVETDAAAPDAAVEAPPDAPIDAFVPPDAPVERCNGGDDDGDGRVDEQPDVCAGFEGGICLDGTCVCRDPSLVPHGGFRDDCNEDPSDGCETPIDTDENCGGCGLRCDASRECVDSFEHGLRCRVRGVLDFTAAEEGGDIACLVALDGRVACRGPNAFHAISDTEPSDATLDWTFVPLPPAVQVRASLQTHADGTRGLAICAVGVDMGVRVLTCRGDNSTGLLGLGHGEPIEGNREILPAETEAFEFVVWRGEGMVSGRARSGDHSIPIPVYRWGAEGQFRRAEIVARSGYFSRADMAYVGSDSLLFWGPHASFLAGEPGSAPPLDTPAPHPAAPTFPAPACFRDVCCTGARRVYTPLPRGEIFRLQCWGRSPYDAGHGYASVPVTFYRDGVIERRRSEVPGETRPVFLATSSGPRVCIVLREDFPEDRYWCADASEVLAASLDEPAPLEWAEEIPVVRREYPEFRVGWQGLCRQERPDWWRCWGGLSGWNDPPEP